jgi:magnesium-transporting ATPase (P-type)
MAVAVSSREEGAVVPSPVTAAEAAGALHSSVRHSCVALRDGHPRTVDVTELVPGDVVDPRLGQVVPADLRLLAVRNIDGNVALSGTVPSYPQYRQAARAAQRAAGVTSVHNHLEVAAAG